MQVLKYQHSRGSTQVERVDIQTVSSFANQRKFVICDSYFQSTIPANFYLEANESNKTIETALNICEAMSLAGVKRGDSILVVGGGVSGDVAGFACAIYLRGVEWDFAPTTLLSQVDSSLGGKVGVNTKLGKNLLGQFHQPRNIYLCHSFLKTLPQSEISSGWGEIFKYEEIAHEKLTSDFPQIPKTKVIESCLRIKANFVEQDEFDLHGQRALLNMGHTLGHAIESSQLYEVTHGEAVWWGILFEKFYEHRDLSLCSALFKFQPCKKEQILELEADQLISYMMFDKKGEMNFIISRSIKQISQEDFEQTWNLFRAKFKIYEDHINRN